jgi:hypothetical protein
VTARSYPTKWYRVQQRGCGLNGTQTCQRIHLPLERRELAPGKFQTRHIYPRPVIFAALETQTRQQVDTGRQGDTWWATLMEGRRDSAARQVSGATEREALQNLADLVRVQLP